MFCVEGLKGPPNKHYLILKNIYGSGENAKMKSIIYI